MQYECLDRYFSNIAIRQAVDALVDKLDGTKPPDLTWKHAQQYSRALLIAAQVRADFIELMFDVWERTFGEACRSEFPNYCENHWGRDVAFYGPEPVWNDGEIGRTYYRDNMPEKGGRNEEFYVETPKQSTLCLRVYRFRDIDKRNQFEEHDFENWEILPGKYIEQSTFATTTPIPITELIAEFRDQRDFPRRLVGLKEAAIEMISYLVDH